MQNISETITHKKLTHLSPNISKMVATIYPEAQERWSPMIFCIESPLYVLEVPEFSRNLLITGSEFSTTSHTRADIRVMRNPTKLDSMILPRIS